ncbi:MAG: hypothetical protein RSC64_00805 [Hydrogenoanaerobacterium sp.]
MSNKKRYIIIMIISVLMNQGFFMLREACKLPVWLDMTGTALAALALEPTAGLMVGLINNFVLAAFYYDDSSLIYYAVSAAVAVIVGTRMRVGGKVKLRRVFTTVLLVIAVTTVISTVITIWRMGAMPDDYWEIYYYSKAIAIGAPKLIACLFGTFVIRLYDTLASVFVVGAFYLLLPKKLKNHVAEIQVSA